MSKPYAVVCGFKNTKNLRLYELKPSHHTCEKFRVVWYHEGFRKIRGYYTLEEATRYIQSIQEEYYSPAE